MSTDITIQKPKKVSYAINLLIASIIFGVVNTIITEMTNYSSDNNLFMNILSIVLMMFFIYQMDRGKKWARTTILVVFILGSFFFILGAIVFPQTLITIFKSSPFIVSLYLIIQIILQTISLIMIYSKTANEWFNSDKDLDI